MYRSTMETVSVHDREFEAERRIGIFGGTCYVYKFEDGDELSWRVGDTCVLFKANGKQEDIPGIDSESDFAEHIIYLLMQKAGL